MRRVPVQIRLDIERGRIMVGGLSVNISPSGICFTSPEPIEPKERFHLILYLPEGKNEFSLLKVEASEVWQKPFEDGFKVGAKFEAFAPGDERRIRGWLLSLMNAAK